MFYCRQNEKCQSTECQRRLSYCVFRHNIISKKAEISRSGIADEAHVFDINVHYLLYFILNASENALWGQG